VRQRLQEADDPLERDRRVDEERARQAAEARVQARDRRLGEVDAVLVNVCRCMSTPSAVSRSSASSRSAAVMSSPR
jgi:hypothetical protein